MDSRVTCCVLVVITSEVLLPLRLTSEVYSPTVAFNPLPPKHHNDAYFSKNSLDKPPNIACFWNAFVVFGLNDLTLRVNVA